MWTHLTPSLGGLAYHLLSGSSNKALLYIFNPVTPHASLWHTHPLAYGPRVRSDKAPGGRYLSEGLAVSLAGLLSDQRQLLALLAPLVHPVDAGQQAHEQHEGDHAQHGEDGYSQRRQLIG